MFGNLFSTSSQEWPPLAAHVSLELYTSSSGSRFVILQVDGVVTQLAAPCADTYCRIEDFAALVQGYAFPGDSYAAACK